MTLLAPAGAGAAVRYVSIGGRNEYPYATPESAARSIQLAVDASQEGDEVVVGPGLYTEHVVLKRGLSLRGSAQGEAIVHGVVPMKPALTLTWDNAVSALTVVGSPYDGTGIYAELGVPPAKVGTFRLFRITDCRVGPCAGSGILVVARQVVLDGISFQQHGGSTTEWEALLKEPYNSELEVEVSGCEIRGCGGAGMAVHIDDPLGKYEGRDYLVPGGQIQLGFKHGLLKVSGSTISSCGQDAVIVQAGWFDRARLIMEGCVVRDNGRDGVRVVSGGASWNGALARIDDSLIAGNMGAGVWCFSIDDGVWAPPGAEPIGFEPSATGDVIVTSSTITGNSVGLVGAPFPPGLAGGGGAWIRLYNSIVYGNTQYDLDFRWFSEYAMWMATGIVHSCVAWEELAGIRGNIASGPLFADPENGDFRLRPGSPCIDAGGMYWQPTVAFEDATPIISWDAGKDLDGNPRISGEAPDMGAYETAGDAPNYVLESSADLVNWTEEYLGPGTSWSDPNAGSSRTRFYRLSMGRH
jgi:hypothetical protein